MRMRDFTAVVTFGLYLLDAVIAIVRPGPHIPPTWVYLLTVPPLVAFVGYRLVRGQTFNLSENVTLAVLVLTGFTLLLPWASAAAGVPPLVQPPLDYYVLTGAPVLGYLAIRLATRVARWRRPAPTNGDW